MKQIVLSISGGGIRGVLPALALCALEEQLGRPTRELVHFVGGTSTGALLTACIAAGIPAKLALGVYTTRGHEVFSPADGVRRRLHLITRGYMFDNKVLHQVVSDTLGSRNAMRINDSPIPILITAANLLGDAWYFTKNRPSNARTTGTALLVDAAVASACAPTYHDAWPIPGFGRFFDGGACGLADPVYQVCVEAFNDRACYGTINPTDAVVISLGTGYYRPDKMPHPPDDLLENVEWATSSLIGSSKSFAQECVDRHWPGALQVFNPRLESDIDEAEVGAIPKLLEVGKKQAASMDWGKILAG